MTYFKLRLRPIIGLFLALLLLLVVGLLSGCIGGTRLLCLRGDVLGGTCQDPKPVQQSPLAIQAIQTQTFDASKHEVFDASMMTLEDIGLFVTTANYDSGIITTTYTATLRDYDYRSIEATITVTLLSENRSQIRINLIRDALVHKIYCVEYAYEDNGRIGECLDERIDNIPESQQVLIPALYQGLFNRIQVNLSTLETLATS